MSGAGNRFNVLSRGLNRRRGEMNKAESEYAAQLEADADVARWWFEPMSLRLSTPEKGQGARYTPDFMLLLKSGMTYLDDVKTRSGFDDNAAIVRIKCAAEQYPLWVFRLVRPRLKRDGGGFDIREV